MRAVSRAVGNCYTAAVYMNLTSLVCNLGSELEGSKVLMFSYGSGAVATAFTILARAPIHREGFTDPQGIRWRVKVYPQGSSV